MMGFSPMKINMAVFSLPFIPFHKKEKELNIVWVSTGLLWGPSTQRLKRCVSVTESSSNLSMDNRLTHQMNPDSPY